MQQRKVAFPFSFIILNLLYLRHTFGAKMNTHPTVVFDSIETQTPKKWNLNGVFLYVVDARGREGGLLLNGIHIRRPFLSFLLGRDFFESLSLQCRMPRNYEEKYQLHITSTTGGGIGRGRAKGEKTGEKQNTLTSERRRGRKGTQTHIRKKNTLVGDCRKE